MSKQMLELADEIEKLAKLDAMAGVGSLCARNSETIVAALRQCSAESAEPVAFVYTLRGVKSYSPTRLEDSIALGWHETPLYAAPPTGRNEPQAAPDDLPEGYRSTAEQIAQLQRNAGLPLPPTPFTYWYRLAMSGEGPHAYNWSDKPHRLIYDLCSALERRCQAVSASSPLAWLADHKNYELSYSCWDEDQVWQVHSVNGGRNDREWTLIATGTTPEEALEKAASLSRPERGEVEK